MNSFFGSDTVGSHHGIFFSHYNYFYFYFCVPLDVQAFVLQLTFVFRGCDLVPCCSFHGKPLNAA